LLKVLQFILFRSRQIRFADVYSTRFWTENRSPASRYPLFLETLSSAGAGLTVPCRRLAAFQRKKGPVRRIPLAGELLDAGGFFLQTYLLLKQPAPRAQNGSYFF